MRIDCDSRAWLLITKIERFNLKPVSIELMAIGPNGISTEPIQIGLLYCNDIFQVAHVHWIDGVCVLVFGTKMNLYGQRNTEISIPMSGILLYRKAHIRIWPFIAFVRVHYAQWHAPRVRWPDPFDCMVCTLLTLWCKCIRFVHILSAYLKFASNVHVDRVRWESYRSEPYTPSSAEWLTQWCMWWLCRG